MAIRLLVADDHEVVRTGLASLLKETEIEIIAQASNGTEAVERTVEHRPDVVLIDIRMTESDGLTALEKIKEAVPEIPVIMLSTFDNPTYIARSLALGARDYVLKESPREEIVDAIERAAHGESPRHNSVIFPVREAMEKRQRPEDTDIPLTKREMQVLRHLALGLSNKEIGKSLSISVETVKEHVQNILRKLKLSDRTQAAVWAVRRGIVFGNSDSTGPPS
jgi:DNA-binding NarL/FixJ family response regulator